MHFYYFLFTIANLDDAMHRSAFKKIYERIFFNLSGYTLIFVNKFSIILVKDILKFNGTINLKNKPHGPLKCAKK